MQRPFGGRGGHMQPVDARDGLVSFILFHCWFLFCFVFPLTFRVHIEATSFSVFFPVLPKSLGCSKVPTLRSGWRKAEMQKGAERKSPTIPTGREKGRSCYRFSTQYIWNSTYTFCGSPFSELWLEWGGEGRSRWAGSLQTDQFTWRYKTDGCGLVELCNTWREHGRKEGRRLNGAWENHRPWSREEVWCLTWWEAISLTPKANHPQQST